jgi:hypothetical protein
MLWGVHEKLVHLPSPPAPGLTSFELEEEPEIPEAFLDAAFFRVVARRAVRLDILERIDETLSTAAKQQTAATSALNTIVSLLGCSAETAVGLAGALGWTRQIIKSGESESTVWRRAPQRKHKNRRRPPRKKPVSPDSPFAGLAALIPAD